MTKTRAPGNAENAEDDAEHAKVGGTKEIPCSRVAALDP